MTSDLCILLPLNHDFLHFFYLYRGLYISSLINVRRRNNYLPLKSFISANSLCKIRQHENLKCTQGFLVEKIHFKHCNNCECCPVPLFIVRSLWFTHSFYSTNLSVMLLNQIRSEISLFTMCTALLTWNKLPETFFFLSWRAFKVGRLTF